MDDERALVRYGLGRPSLGDRQLGARGHRLVHSFEIAARFGCSTARNKGETLCGNRLTIRRDALEATVMDGLRGRLMDPDLFKVVA
jgi:hypothetical protein